MSLYAASGRVLVLGSLNLDVVVRCARRPEPGETVLGDDLARGAGGKGANQAAAAAAAGARTDLLGLVGDDAEGRMLRAQLEQEGVSLEWVSASGDSPTGTALITVDARGENSIVVVPGANARLGVEDVDRARGAIESVEVLLMQLEVPLEPVAYAARVAPKTTRVILNASPVRPLPDDLLSRADPLVVNRVEAEALLGAGSPGVEEAALGLLALGVRSAVVTAGADGALYVDASRQLAIRPPEVTVVDSTGAGDAFAGAHAAAFASDAPIEHALRVAVDAGARAVGHRGARP